MTSEEYLKQNQPTKQKFNNRKVKVDGLTFDSQAEYRRYCELKLMEQSGVIAGLSVHPKYMLQDAFRHRGEIIRAITYKPDFEYFEGGHCVVEDVKGGRATQTEAFRIRVKLLLKRYPDVEFRTVT
jgi:hypothetical protein